MAKRRNNIYTIAKFAWPVVLLFAALGWYLHGHTIPVLQPAGEIGQKERQLIIYACLLAVIVVVPVYVMTILIALKYKEANHTSETKYQPDFDHSRLFETIWWGIPIAIIAVLSVLTWQSSHALNPWTPIASAQKPLTIQVIALDWKWLFIYPQQHIASVNTAEIPVNTPIEFHLTSDTVMNSFWVPGLGGQIYVMPGMHTRLNELATKSTTFLGSPANIAGSGFARMDFTITSTSNEGFDAWVHHAQQSSKTLDSNTYAQLAKPSDNVQPLYYAHVTGNIFDNVILKYLVPKGSPSILPHVQYEAGVQ